ncbi:hua2-like protein 2 [Phtheirospermum japonicum]|uniref:Hua2-like protein 2 n=1 Tax=Phtheirospermum japonicum TaxID=374723 RepID=A0A830CKL9_9LAMI|nr:hua2-like protein 2 [Phtheirospermum japonicum]
MERAVMLLLQSIWRDEFNCCHVLEDVDCELEMEDVSPSCEVEITSTTNIAQTNCTQTSHHQSASHFSGRASNGPQPMNGGKGYYHLCPPHLAPSNQFSYIQEQRIQSRKDIPIPRDSIHIMRRIGISIGTGTDIGLLDLMILESTGGNHCLQYLVHTIAVVLGWPTHQRRTMVYPLSQKYQTIGGIALPGPCAGIIVLTGHKVLFQCQIEVQNLGNQDNLSSGSCIKLVNSSLWALRKTTKTALLVVPTVYILERYIYYL